MTDLTIEREIVIDAPADVVWRTITEPEQIAQWFADRVELELRLLGEHAPEEGAQRRDLKVGVEHAVIEIAQRGELAAECFAKAVQAIQQSTIGAQRLGLRDLQRGPV